MASTLKSIFLKMTLINLWVNNAGLDGHSTFGHQILLDDYLVKVKPKVILFLTEVNDLENETTTFHDKSNTKGAYSDFVHYLYNNSEVINLAVNLFRGYKAQKYNNTTHKLLLPKIDTNFKLSTNEIHDKLQHQEKYLKGYGERIGRLIDSCLNNNIVPVFVTPAMFIWRRNR